MICGMCVLRKTKNCPNKKIPLTKTPACGEFTLDIRKVSKKVYKLALELTHLSKQQSLALMTLLEQMSRIKSEGLLFGLPVPYKISEDEELVAYLCYLEKEQGRAVAFRDKDLMSVSLPISYFQKYMDQELQKLWMEMQDIPPLTDPKKKVRIVLKKLQSLSIKNVKRFFIVNNIPRIKGTRRHVARTIVKRYL